MRNTSILSGEFKGRKLKTLNSGRIRPTSSRVRKSIFDMLMDMDGKRVLDLFAGSGSLGFEALSVGAQSVTFVDNDNQSLSLLHRNKEKFHTNRIAIFKSDGYQYLEKVKEQFDVIFIDPPYRNPDPNRLKENAMNRLTSGGVLIIETSKRLGWRDKEAKIKEYGETQISIFWREH